ncbi:MAG: hypothetical protein IAE84_05860 [Saprospiraceae bacterium]|nr:hypothetical protein [Saprospiraceae bacterium]HRD79774.1 hypothetical protein [Saprospiraceae bacterium]
MERDRISLQRGMSLEALRLVKGLGKKRIEQYGAGITQIIRTFYQGS